jgi:N-acetylglucosaminyldiphosphoundecaprenol N-acetyl-beta-D-mannosaminyltransferase
MNSRQHIRRRLPILDTAIDAVSWEAMISRIAKWASLSESRYVCLCNAHSVVTGRRDAEFRRVIEAADTAAPDGSPVAWLMRKRGVPSQERIDGPNLMWRYAEQATLDDTPIFLYGTTPDTLDKLIAKLRYTFPGLQIAGHYSPPFRPLSAMEENEVIAMITKSGARVVFVGLGCPRQETWMADISSRIPAVLVGVGAAFDYHAGIVHRAPLWMQRKGLEWLYRLCSEPRRLWRRYLTTNALFLYYLLRDRLTRSNRIVHIR